MSMLAEPKRKVKWTLNPRGNYWAENESNYGQRMLKKMGWEKGKGLGKNEDGNTDHIKVTYKNDKRGIGTIGNDNWIAHQDDFNSVLSLLNEQFESSPLSSKPKEYKPESLEEKSKCSKSRVHYHKFIRGKDVARYSNKDMAAIFGNKKKDKELKNEESSDDDCKESNTSSTIITYNSGQSIQEYFKQKMAALGKKEKKNADSQSNCFNMPSRDENNLASHNDFIQSTNSGLIGENQQSDVMTKRKNHKKQKKRKDMNVDMQFKCENDQSTIKDTSLAESNATERKLCYKYVENYICNPSLVTENHKNNFMTTVEQEKIHPTESESSTDNNFISKKKSDNTMYQFPDNDKLIELTSKKSKQKRKLDSMNYLEIREYKSSIISTSSLGGSGEINNEKSTDTEIANNRKSLFNSVTLSNEIKDYFSVKTKKEKRKKNVVNESGDATSTTKKSRRCNALQQMKLYFDVFPNRQILPVLKKYEALCENFNDTGLASSNLLSLPGYGNELLSKDQ